MCIIQLTVECGTVVSEHDWTLFVYWTEDVSSLSSGQFSKIMVWECFSSLWYTTFSWYLLWYFPSSHGDVIIQYYNNNNNNNEMVLWRFENAGEKILENISTSLFKSVQHKINALTVLLLISYIFMIQMSYSATPNFMTTFDLFFSHYPGPLNIH